MQSQSLGPRTLEGKYVRLEPLREEHAEELANAAKKLDWSLFLYPLLSRDDVDKRIVSGIEKEQRDEEYAFAVIVKKGKRVAGSTSYLQINSRHKRAEIGSTWYLPEYQGTFVNPECKFLLLRHAFEDWGAVRMQLVTDSNNHHSQRAILKLGARFEGKLRNYGIRPNGKPRDAMVYSITSAEWPDVRTSLVSRIAAF